METTIETSVSKAPCDTYFQCFSSNNKKIIPVGIGDNSIFNLDVADNGNIEVQSRKSRRYRNNEKYTVFIPSLPLDIPNKFKPITTKDFVEVIWDSRSKEEHVIVEEQYNRLMKQHENIFYESLHKKDVKKKLLGNFFDNSTYFFKRKQTKLRRWKAYYADQFSDIRKEIIMPLLGESILSEIDNFEENFNLRNCLVWYENEGRCVIFCPTGELMDYLSMKEILIDVDLLDNELFEFEMLKCMELLNVHVDFLIKELSCNNDMLYVRGDYHLYVYHIELTDLSPSLTMKRKYNFDKLVHSIGINDNSMQDIFVVFDDRAIYQIVDKSEPNKIVYDSNLEKVKWQTCMYGKSRATCLISNRKEVLMYDFRIQNTIPSTYLDITTCSFVNKEMELSPAMFWNPLHQHQYFLSSDQNIFLNDERYLKTPVLQFNHFLKSPPYFLQLVSDSNEIDHNSLLSEDQNALLLAGAYKSSDSVLCQLSSNGVIDVSFGNSEKLKCHRPVTISQPLFQLSSYDDWKTYVSDWRFSLSCYKRLHQPCIGISLSRLSSHDNHFHVISQSLSGDLFFQQILRDTCAYDAGINRLMQENVSAFQSKSLVEQNGDNVTLAKTCKRKCELWMNSIVEDQFTNKTKDHEVSDGSKTEMKEKVIESCDVCEMKEHLPTCNEKEAFEYGNPNDILINEIGHTLENIDGIRKSHVCLLELDENSEDVCFCSSCSDKWFDNLTQIKDESKIVTRNALGLPDAEIPCSFIKLVEDLKYHERPLNRVLRAQWEEKYYVPLDKFATDLVFDVEQYL